MKKIAAVLWTEPVVFAGVVTGVASALAAEGLISGWIPVVLIAATAPVLRHFVSPTRR